MVWQKIQELHKNNIPFYLLIVAASQGSSPGRPGFKMCVGADGSLTGSIGGGRVEVDTVELCRRYLKDNILKTEYLFRRHFPDHSADSSGMICSGSQEIILLPSESFGPLSVSIVRYLADGRPFRLEINPGQLDIIERPVEDRSTPINFRFSSAENWQYSELIGLRPRCYIVGGGHVALAVVRLLKTLHFETVVYYDRENNTSGEISKVSEISRFITYENLHNLFPFSEESYGLIMTSGHSGDEVVLGQMLNLPWRYLGMMGSKSKVRQVFDRLRAKGFAEEKLKQVHAPVGLPINSHTPEEIAVSIAAEMIKVKNS